MANIPKGIKQQLLSHKTSLGDNPCYPPENELPFDYRIVKDSFNEINDEVNNLDEIDSSSVDGLKNSLSELIFKCQKIESPIRDQLETICFNFVNDMFDIPRDVIFECSLMDSISSDGKRLVPDNTDDLEFDGVEEINKLNEMVYKRRMINALIRGGSLYYASMIESYVSHIYKINPKLPELYKKILVLSSYLIYFADDFKVMKSGNLYGSVDVYLGEETEAPKILAKGIIFPILLSESIRGFMELFASHGLPKDKKSAEYVIKKSDFLLAEPWDIRLGVPLWNIFHKKIPGSTKMLPFFLTEFFSLGTDKFYSMTKEILASTKKGSNLIDKLVNHIKFELNKDEFNSYISTKNREVSQINDGYFTTNELKELYE